MPALPRSLLVLLPLAGLSGLLPCSVSAQEATPGSPLLISDSPETPAPAPAIAPAIAPLKLDIARRDLKNFLTDAESLSPYLKVEGISASLQEIFVIGSGAVPRAVFWDPLACRLLGVLDLDAPAPAPQFEVQDPGPEGGEERTEGEGEDTPPPAPPSPYLLMAEGRHPLTGSGGGSGRPVFFGFRLVGGMPEFLYTFGALAVEERLWLDEGGTVMKQRFSVRDAPRGLQITLPESWKTRAEASAGTWEKNVLTVPKESSAEVILSYRLSTLPPPLPAESN